MSAAHRLFEPVRLGPLTLKNRTIRAAAFEGMAPGHDASDALIAYHRAVADGGVGMTTVAYAAVDRSGLAFPHQLWLRPQAVPGLRALTDAVHAAGAMASIQLGHCGNMANTAVTGGRAVAPSARFNLYGPTWPRAMDGDDIARVVAAFGDAVRIARDAGFDAVEVHAGHGYLVSQFLSPATNRRTDAYGGPLDRRLRFAREVLASVKRAAASDVAVLVKTNLFDGFRGGNGLDEGVAIARALEEEGADALVLSGGFVSRAPMAILRGAMPVGVMAGLMPWGPKRWMVGLIGDRLIPAVPYEPCYFLAEARVVRDAVRLPLVYVGGVDSRAAADEALSHGFDAVAIARALIRDPDFVRRMQAEEAHAACDHCNYCAARIYTTHMACHHREPAPEGFRRLLPPADP